MILFMKQNTSDHYNHMNSQQNNAIRIMPLKMDQGRHITFDGFTRARQLFLENKILNAF